jgi:hypothetical protein
MWAGLVWVSAAGGVAGLGDRADDVCVVDWEIAGDREVAVGGVDGQVTDTGHLGHLLTHAAFAVPARHSGHEIGLGRGHG